MHPAYGLAAVCTAAVTAASIAGPARAQAAPDFAAAAHACALDDKNLRACDALTGRAAAYWRAVDCYGFYTAEADAGFRKGDDDTGRSLAARADAVLAAAAKGGFRTDDVRKDGQLQAVKLGRLIPDDSDANQRSFARMAVRCALHGGEVYTGP